MKVTAFIRKTSAKNNVTNLARVYFRVRDIGGVDIKAASELSINPNTIQRAYSQLEKTGVIYSVKGKGNFVAADPKRLREEKMEQILQEMEKLLRQALALGAGKEKMEH